MLALWLNFRNSPDMSPLSSGDEIGDDTFGYEPHLNWVSRDIVPRGRFEKTDSVSRFDLPETNQAIQHMHVGEGKLRMRMKFISELKVGDKIISLPTSGSSNPFSGYYNFASEGYYFDSNLYSR